MSNVTGYFGMIMSETGSTYPYRTENHSSLILLKTIKIEENRSVFNTKFNF
jgi:hypothetical protein